VRGEVEYAVPPLAEREAVALFCERAQLEPSDEIADLCARLDALPLAVELAAARTKALTPAQILERLSQRLDLLKGGRDADPRQQTLRATIEWSYELLTTEEQRLFRSLAVFAGGCTLEAAEEVCDADPDTLQSLVEKNLLRFTPSDSTGRYWMLEMIREYARDRFAARPEAMSVRRAHAAHYCALAVELSTIEHSGEHVARLSAEHENMGVAFELALERDDVPLAADLMHGLWRYWLMTGRTEEARSCTGRYLRAGRRHVAPLRRVHGDHGAGEILRFTGDEEAAATLKYELVETARANPDVVLHGRSVERVLAANLGDLAHIELDRGRLSVAQSLAEEALAVRRRIGGPVAHALHALAAIAYDAGDYERARALMADATLEFDADGDPLGRLLCRAEVAECDLLLGNGDSAADALREIVDEMPAVPDQNLELNVLRLAAMVATARGDTQRAAVLFGAAEARLEKLGLVLFGPASETTYRSYVDRARNQLGAADFEAAYAAGTDRRDDDVPGLVFPAID
jgi:tetratricopeptide (TPR) repeat protein